MKNVLVFGVFDVLHDGHRNFLRQACKVQIHADRVWLIACVTRDEMVEALKGHKPKQDLDFRIQALRESGLVDEAVEGDQRLGSWEVVGKYKPDVIALGYDQEDLKTALLQFIRKYDLDIEVRTMEAYRPDELHSSIF